MESGLIRLFRGCAGPGIHHTLTGDLLTLHTAIISDLARYENSVVRVPNVIAEQVLRNTIHQRPSPPVLYTTRGNRTAACILKERLTPSLIYVIRFLPARYER